MTQVATAQAAGSAAEAAEGLSRDIRASLPSPRLIVLFASTSQPLTELSPLVSSAFPDAVVIGASTAGEFVAAGDTQGHSVAFAVDGDFEVHAGLGRGLSEDPQAAVSAALEGLPAEVDGYPHRTGLVLLDTLAGKGEEAALLASVLLGSEVRLAGGAAGDQDMTETIVSFGGDVGSNAIAMAVLHTREPLGIGVDHGHQPVSEPVKVTRAEGSVVYEIDGRPAWDVWAEKTRAVAAERGIDVDALSDPGEIFSFLVVYEAGLTLGDTYKMRAPMFRNDDGSLTFACGIPEGAVIRIMKGEQDAQVESAGRAAASARAQLGERAIAGALIFDCVCRKAILGDDFVRAVKAMDVALGGASFAGIETFGEIALEVGDMSGFHNTTTVVVAFPE